MDLFVTGGSVTDEAAAEGLAELKRFLEKGGELGLPDGYEVEVYDEIVLVD